MNAIKQQFGRLRVLDPQHGVGPLLLVVVLHDRCHAHDKHVSQADPVLGEIVNATGADRGIGLDVPETLLRRRAGTRLGLRSSLEPS